MNDQGKAVKPTSGDMPHVELRSVVAEIRMVDGPEGPKIRGYGAVWDSPSQVMRMDDGTEFVEYVRRGAFSRAIAEGDCRALFNHDTRMILGRRGAGSLRLGEDETGLWYEIDPPDTTYARDLMSSMSRGDVNGSSFSFAVIDDLWSDGPNGRAVRDLRSVHLFDVGPVTFPAYRATSASLRSLEAHRAEARKLSDAQRSRLELLKLRLELDRY